MSGVGAGRGIAAAPKRRPLDEWERLFRAQRPAIRTILVRYRIPPEEADDLVQTTFLEALRQAPTIRHPVAWMIGTLRHHCLEHRRRGHRLRRRQVSLDSGAPHRGDGAEPAEGGVRGKGGRPQPLDLPVVPGTSEAVERRLYLLSLLRPLPIKLRVLLVARYLYGMVDHEVAELTGLATGSVRKMTLRALERVRAEAGRLRRPGPP